MYHYVRDFSTTKYPKINGLDVKFFENQIQYFVKNYKILSIDEVVFHIETQKDLPERSLLLTFDDGYSDHYQYVLPILKKYKLKGAFYIPSSVLEQSQVLGVNKIHFLLATVKENELVNSIFKFIDKYRDDYQLKKNLEYYDLYKNNGYHLDSQEARFIKKILQLGLPFELRIMITNQLFEERFLVSESEFSRELYLSNSNIKEMINEGMHIGSHAHSHLWLNTLNRDEQKLELFNSLKFLKRFGITENLTICYPYGAYNTDTLDIAEELGFKLGFSTKQTVADLNSENLLSLSRLDTNELPKSSDII